MNVTLSKQKQSDSEIVNCRYFTIPFIGRYSNTTKHKLKKLIGKFCKGIEVKFIFTTSKIGTYFSVKDRIPDHLVAMVVYKFVCANCNVCYVGETSRHLATRINEHLNSDKSSHIYKHLQLHVNCKEANDVSSFSVLDHAKTSYQLKLKEALHISFAKPELNKQVRNYGVNLTS